MIKTFDKNGPYFIIATKDFIKNYSGNLDINSWLNFDDILHYKEHIKKGTDFTIFQAMFYIYKESIDKDSGHHWNLGDVEEVSHA